MTQTEIQRKTGIEYFIQLVPFSRSQFSQAIQGKNFVADPIINEGNVWTQEMMAATEAAFQYAGGIYNTGKSEKKLRLVDITKYTDGRLEIDVREEEFEEQYTKAGEEVRRTGSQRVSADLSKR